MVKPALNARNCRFIPLPIAFYLPVLSSISLSHLTNAIEARTIRLVQVLCHVVLS